MFLSALCGLQFRRTFRFFLSLVVSWNDTVFFGLPGLRTSLNSQLWSRSRCSPFSVSGQSERPENLPLSAVCSVLNSSGFLEQISSACTFLFLWFLLVQIVWELSCQRAWGSCQASSWDSLATWSLGGGLGFIPTVLFEKSWWVLNLLTLTRKPKTKKPPTNSKSFANYSKAKHLLTNDT